MSIVRDREIRFMLSKVCRALNARIPNLPPPARLTLGQVDFLTSELIESIRKESIRDSRRHLSQWLSLAYLGALTIGFFSLAFYWDRPWRSSRKNRSSRSNTVLWSLLAQATNRSLGVIYTVQDGLDQSARALLRVFYEIVWLIVAVSSDQGRQRLFAEARESVEVWRSNFSPKKLQESLANLEAGLGLSSSRIKALTNIRKEEYHYYSQSVHPSYLFAFVGSLAPMFEKENVLKSAVFGGASAGSESTLIDLVRNKVYLLTLLLPALKLGKVAIPAKDPFWQGALALRFCFLSIVENFEKAGKLPRTRGLWRLFESGFSLAKDSVTKAPA